MGARRVGPGLTVALSCVLVVAGCGFFEPDQRGESPPVLEPTESREVEAPSDAEAVATAEPEVEVLEALTEEDLQSLTLGDMCGVPDVILLDGYASGEADDEATETEIKASKVAFGELAHSTSAQSAAVIVTCSQRYVPTGAFLVVVGADAAILATRDLHGVNGMKPMHVHSVAIDDGAIGVNFSAVDPGDDLPWHASHVVSATFTWDGARLGVVEPEVQEYVVLTPQRLSREFVAALERNDREAAQTYLADDAVVSSVHLPAAGLTDLLGRSYGVEPGCHATDRDVVVCVFFGELSLILEWTRLGDDEWELVDDWEGPIG